MALEDYIPTERNIDLVLQKGCIIFCYTLKEVAISQNQKLWFKHFCLLTLSENMFSKQLCLPLFPGASLLDRLPWNCIQLISDASTLPHADIHCEGLQVDMSAIWNYPCNISYALPIRKLLTPRIQCHKTLHLGNHMILLSIIVFVYVLSIIVAWRNKSYIIASL